EMAHIILRGGADGPNYDRECIKKTHNQLKEEGLLAKIMVDFSHANSQKKFKNQLLVGDEIAKQVGDGSDKIFGVMIESHINEGNQPVGPLESLEYGVSITDSCIGWDDTENLLKTLAQAVQKRNS
ncbi:MAG: 3-deoxy-7-phosphoheptulonate synthase, partial [Gammaproteobacteria bacterium]